MEVLVSVDTQFVTLEPSAQQSRQAGELRDQLTGQREAAMVTLRVPREMAGLLAQLMPHIASGAQISFTALPENLTTTTAAAMLGMSRPTLMKLVGSGKIPSHKVGSHTRLRLEDVNHYRASLLQERREAYEALLRMDEEAGITE